MEGSHSRLIIGPFRVNTSLGCEDEEHHILQEVEFTLTISFEHEPKSCESDLLSETVCYASVCQAIQSVASSRHFNLIEHLAKVCVTRLKSIVPNDATLTLIVHKLKPPVQNLVGGAKFEMTMKNFCSK
ncbi:MAG: dihydroneopterin aldolase [Bdellovibrionales bacterium]|nr:dihydroneopterin aldolase [Bdellovibrionales bacterium]